MKKTKRLLDEILPNNDLLRSEKMGKIVGVRILKKKKKKG